MESKKINQLATNVAPQTSDLTIIGDPITGVSKKITLLQIANLFSTTGTVSSVAVTETGDALTITGSPITSAGTINIGFAGDATQYVRGDGALADFPTSTGGGSSVSYYLNSSVSQGTIGGVAYRQLSKTPIAGAGTDITISANGYVASYITDANDPALLEVPAGNFNCEFYFSVNSNNHNPYVYAEVYKYDGTTFSLIGTSVGVPEYLSNGTTLSPYYFAIPVSQTVLTITDRIAIRIFVNVDGRTVTLHTENGHLCQVVTTFSKGLTSLNNLTRQVQFLATGTSGTDFNISSSTATHTFNLPVASATNTGKLSSTDWSTFNGKVPYTGANANVNLGVYELLAQNAFLNGVSGVNGGNLFLRQDVDFGQSAGYTTLYSTGKNLGFVSYVGSFTYNALFSLNSLTNNSTRTYTLPDASGTLALTSNLSSYVPYSGATSDVNLGIYGLTLGNNLAINGNNSSQGGFIGFKQFSTTQNGLSGYTSFSALNSNILYLSYSTGVGTSKYVQFDNTNITNNSGITLSFPNASGTLALTSNLSDYVTLATTQTISGAKTFGSSVTINTAGQSILSIVSSAGNSSDITSSVAGVLKSTISTSATEFKLISAIDNILKFQSSTNFRASLIFSNSADYSYTYPNASGTIALTSNLSAYLPLTGGTLTGALSGTSATFSSTLAVGGSSIGRANGIRINGVSVTQSSNTYNAFISTTTTQAADIGGSLGLGGEVGGDNVAFAVISGRKENSTSGNYAGYFAVATIDGGASMTEKFRITSSGNVGIGTSSPSSTINPSAGTVLALQNTSTFPSFVLKSTNDAEAGITLANSLFIDCDGNSTATNNNIIFRTGNVNSTITATERMRITSGGDLGIGTSTINYASGGRRVVEINGPSTTLLAFKIADTAKSYLFHIGSDFIINNLASGYLGFENNGAERMRITSGGNVLIGTTTDNGAKFQVVGRIGTSLSSSGANFNNSSLYVNNTANTKGAIFGYDDTNDRFYFTSLEYGVQFKPILFNTSGATFSFLAGTGSRAVLADANGLLSAPVSDITVKQNITSIGYGLNEILKMNPVWFDFIDEYKNYGEGRQNGNIAQEMEAIIPEAVFVTPSTGKMGINYDQMHAVYIKAIQELKAEIEELKNK